MAELPRPEPTIRSVLEKRSLKWIFVGGKGGVGKTTCSCCIAMELAKVRDNVLIISTDPAHNLSDAFGQRFSKEPTLVSGFTNLYAMEIDPTLEQEEEDLLNKGSERQLFHQLAQTLPGVDEAMSFAEVLRLVESMDFSVIVFDTAPTGHTLRLLSFPATLEHSLGPLFNLKSRFAGLFTQLSNFLMPGSPESEEQMATRLDTTLRVIKQVNVQFQNPDLTTFICVLIPEFLSLFETERLVQELANKHIDVSTLLVNQVLYPDKECQCKLCTARARMQAKYLQQIDELYEDFHVVRLPLLPNEVRGVEDLRKFAQHMLVPYQG